MKLGALLTSALALVACGDDATLAPGTDGGGDLTGPRTFTLRIENVAPWTVLKAGTVMTRTNDTDGPLGPGQAYELRFTAAAGHAISFATMLAESNDWFFAPGPEGIPLYDRGTPVSGDVTHLVRLWDAGTESNQEPGVGDATGPKQPLRTYGADDLDDRVREVPETVTLIDGSTFVRPATASMIRVTLTPGADQSFTLRIQNVSTTSTLRTSRGAMAVHLSPVAFAIHRDPGALFDAGKPARENGLEMLAEAGQPDTLGTSLRYARGTATGLSPGVFVIHDRAAPLFEPGSPDVGMGLERLAEDGDPVPLRETLTASPPDGVVFVGGFDTPVASEAPGLAMPGQAFEVSFQAEPGDAVSFATMFGMSNDWFFATQPEGIALFHGDIPRSCDMTANVRLYDLGTEADEELDVGPNTAPQQPEPDTGRPDRTAEVRAVTIERYDVPPVLHLRVTLTPQ